MGDKMETLKIDIDIKDFLKVKSIIGNRARGVFSILDIKPIGCRVYSTHKGYHVYIEVFGDYNSFDLCFLQMALGLDYKRETFNFMRFRNSLDKKWNVLFSKKYDGNGNVISFETEEPKLSELLWDEINGKRTL
jgi:hypothetical protein